MYSGIDLWAISPEMLKICNLAADMSLDITSLRGQLVEKLIDITLATNNGTISDILPSHHISHLKISFHDAVLSANSNVAFKAALPLAESLATASCRSSNTDIRAQHWWWMPGDMSRFQLWWIFSLFWSYRNDVYLLRITFIFQVSPQWVHKVASYWMP